MGVSGGLDLAIGERTALLFEPRFNVYSLSADFVDDCAPGIGTPTTLTGQVAFAYRFDG
jgi:hypothetical protein